MPNQYTPEFKKHHIDAWRASGLTRRQYCAAEGLSEGTFKHWPSQLNARHFATPDMPSVLPVQIAPPQPGVSVTDTVMLYLPGGCRLSCQPAQLAEVLRALNYAQA